MSELVADITDAEFTDQVLNADKSVIVDFWAPWCGPCKMIAPLLEATASEHENDVKIVKINIDNFPDVAAKYGVRGIPTLLKFENGEVAATHVGALGKSELEAFVSGN